MKTLSKYFEVIYVVTFFSGKSTRFQLFNNVFCYSIARPSKNLLLSYGISHALHTYYLLRICIRHKIDMIRAQDPVISGFPSIIVGKILRIPVIIKCAGFPIEIARYQLMHYFGRSQIFKIIKCIINLIQLIVFSMSSYVFAVSPATERYALKYKARRVIQIGVFLNTKLFKSLSHEKNARASKKRRILYVGRLVPEKGIYTLLKIAKLLKDPNIEFVIIGDGPERDKLVALIDRLNMKSRVKIVGKIPHKNMPEWYHKSDIFILPSFTEGMPVALLEAMVCGVPSIVSRVGDIPLVFEDKKHVLMVPPGDIKGFVRMIDLLLKNKSLADYISKNAESYVKKKFNEKAWLLSQLKIFNEIYASRYR